MLDFCRGLCYNICIFDERKEKKMRNPSDILQELSEAVIDYNSKRDREDLFRDEHPEDYWDDPTMEKWNTMTSDTLSARNRVQELLRESTGKKYLIF